MLIAQLQHKHLVDVKRRSLKYLFSYVCEGIILNHEG